MKSMKGAIVLAAGAILMIIVVVLLLAVVVCTLPTNEDAFYCQPLAPLAEMISAFF